ncbi:MAG: tail fiber domain-containing protein [Candidatus Blackburnbacteria bacterium]|nr:tail fiber domain-containing protein [Candidatus Blackburnbacteria bacterium]
MVTLPHISEEVLKKYQGHITKLNSPATALRKNSSLRHFFSWAHKEGHFASNPFRGSESSANQQTGLPVNQNTDVPDHRPSGVPTVRHPDRPSSPATRIFVLSSLGFSTIAVIVLAVLMSTRLPVGKNSVFVALKSLAQITSVSEGQQASQSDNRPYGEPANQLTGTPALLPTDVPTSPTYRSVESFDTLTTQIIKGIGGALSFVTEPTSDGDIVLAPDGLGQVKIHSSTTSQDSFSITNANLATGDLVSGYVGNNSTSYNLLYLSSGSAPVERFSVDALGNTYVDGNIASSSVSTKQINLSGNLAVGGVTRLNSFGRLASITGYYQDSGLFAIDQGSPDSARITKFPTSSQGPSSADVLTLTLNETNTTTSNYDTLVLERNNAGSTGYALDVKSGNANFEGNVSITGTLTTGGTGGLTAASLSVTGATTLSSTLTVTGATTLSSTLSVTGATTLGTTTAAGQLTATRAPTSAHTGTWAIDSSTWNVSDSTAYINPSSATADANLLGLAVGGNVRFAVDAEGDIYGKNLVLTGSTSVGNQTVSGDLAVEGNTTLGDATSDTLTVNPATLTLAGGNKTIDVTGAATRTLTVLNSTTSQVADLDLSDGSLKVGGTTRISNAGIGTFITGTTIGSQTFTTNNIADSGALTIASGGTGNLTLNTSDSSASISLSANTTLAAGKTFTWTTGAIDTNGKVGIGTASPGQQLEITGNFKLPATTTTTGIIYAGTNRFIHNYGSNNAFVGISSGNLTMTGTGNAFFGYNAGSSVTSGSSNAFFGSSAGSSNTAALANSFFGAGAGGVTTTGSANTFIGTSAGGNNVSGTRNTYTGMSAGLVATGNDNAYYGYASGGSGGIPSVNSGNQNSFFGSYAGTDNNTGVGNVYIGYYSETSGGSGSYNTFVGTSAIATSDVSSSIALGYAAAATANNQLLIGADNANGYITDGYLGRGVTTATPTTFSLHSSGGSTAGTVGSDFKLIGGAGSTATTGAAGGSIYLIGGDGGGTGDNNGGNVYVYGGAKTGSGTVGNTLLAVNSSGTAVGNVGIGTTSPTANLDIRNSSLTTGTALYVAPVGSASTRFSGDLANFNLYQTYSGAAANASGNLLDIDREITRDISGTGAYTVNGAVVQIQSFTTTTGTGSGTVADTSNILSLTQNTSTATGAVLNITNAGTGTALAVTNTSGGYAATFNTGNVGVGTTSPAAYTLQVAGNIGPNASPTLTSITQTATAIDTSASGYASVAIGTDGYPVIAYHDGGTGALSVYKCSNTSCSTGSTATVDSGQSAGQYASITIGTDGLPVISYYDGTNFDLKIVKCGNASCSSGNTTNTIDSTGDVGIQSSIAIGTDGYPVISYNDSTNGDLKVIKCADILCAPATNTTNSVDTTGNTGYQTSIAIGTDGYPVISYLDGGNGDLKVAKCGDSSCTPGSATISTPDTIDGTNSSIAIGKDGLPVISYIASGLKVYKCSNVSCSAGSAQTLDNTINSNTSTSIAIGTDGLPIVAYDLAGLTGDLKVAKCGDGTCTSGNATKTTVESTNRVGLYVNMAIGADSLPIIAHYDLTNADIRTLKCATTNCATTTGSALAGGYSLGGWMANSRSYSSPFQTINTLQISNPTTFQNLSFLTAGSEKLTITPSGNIGVGTTSPASALDVANTSNTAATLAVTNNTATTIGASASLGVTNFVSTSLTTGALVNLQLTEGTLAGGYYLRGWDATGGAAVFTVGEDGATTIAGLEGSNMLTLTAGDAVISDGSLSITDDDDAATFTLTNNTASTIGNGANTSGVLDLQSTSLSTGNFLNVEVNALTSGTGINLTSTSTTTTGDLAKFELTGNSGSSLTGNALKVGITGTSASGNSVALNVTNGNTGSSAYVARFNDDGTYTDSTPFVIDGSGNVGIGTTNPTASLSVAGFVNPTTAPTISSLTQTATSVITSYTTASAANAIAVGADGYPVIASAATNGLRVVKCSVSDCSTGNTTTTIGSANITELSIVIGTDGLPVISYNNYDSGLMIVTKCGNSACSAGNTTTTIDSSATVGRYSSIAVGRDGLPIVSYYDTTNGNLKVIKCGNISCSSGNTTNSLDTTGDVGTYTSTTIGTDGLPIVSYRDVTNSALKVMRCTADDCSANTIVTVDASGVDGWTQIAIGTDGLPFIAYRGTSSRVKVAKCGDAGCSAGNTLTSLGASPSVSGQTLSLAIGKDGIPVISYYDGDTYDLRVARCANIVCSSFATNARPESSGDIGTGSSVAIGTDGMPIIAYTAQTASALKVMKCANIGCSATTGTALAGGYSLGSWRSNNSSYSLPFATVNALQIANPTNFQNLSFLTSGTEKLTITPGGSIGIGTTSPGGLLDIATGLSGMSSATQYIDKISASLTGGIDTTAQTALHARYTVPTVNITGSSATVTSVYGNYSGLTASAGTVTNWYGNYVAAPTGAGTVSNKYAFVSEANSGNVGIGLTNPTHQLELSTDDAAKTTTTTWTTTSDARTKKNITAFLDGLDVIKKLKPIEFDYNGLGGTVDNLHSVSLIAQDAQPVAPYLVRSRKGKLNPSDQQDSDILSFNPHGLFFVTINAIKELDQKMSTLTSEVVADLQTGIIVTTEFVAKTISTDTLRANQKVITPLLEVNEVVANHVQTQTLDVAGKVTSQQVNTGEATVSGTLTAQTIEAGEIRSSVIDKLRDRLASLSDQMEQVTAQTATYNQIEKVLEQSATGSAEIVAAATSGVSLGSPEVNVTSNFNVLGDTNVFGITRLANTYVSGDITITSSDPLITNHLSLSTNTITVFGGALQILASDGVDIMNGALLVNQSGDVYISKDLFVGGTLHANTLNIENSAGDEVAAVDASGSATLRKLVIAAPQETATPSAQIANNEVISNSTAGQAVMPAGLTTLIISNPNVTNNTLIYVTPQSSTNNQTLYVLNKVAGSYFAVAIDHPTLYDIKFNWWIIDLKQ